MSHREGEETVYLGVEDILSLHAQIFECPMQAAVLAHRIADGQLFIDGN
jgi:hypothetical protein